MQDVTGRALQIGRRSQFHHATGAEPRQHVEGQFGAAVMRLIHDHEGPTQPQHISQRIRNRSLRAFAFTQQFIALRGRQIVEMVHQCAAGLINLAAFFLFHLKRLSGGDDDRGGSVQRGAGHALGFFQIQHGDRPGFAQSCVVRVIAVFQSLERLLANRLVGRQPQNHAVFTPQQMGIGKLNALGRQPGFAAAGGHAQAEVRHVGGETRQRVIRIAPAP